MKSLERNLLFVLLFVSSLNAMESTPKEPIVNPTDEILETALKSEIKKISHFYANASDIALADLVNSASKVARDQQPLQRYAQKFSKSDAEMKKLIAKVLKKAKARQKINAAKELRRPAQPKSAEKAMPKKKEERGDSFGLAFEDCSLYITLDIPDMNASGKPIDWKNLIRDFSAQIKDTEFLPLDYRHITLAWKK